LAALEGARSSCPDAWAGGHGVPELHDRFCFCVGRRTPMMLARGGRAQSIGSYSAPISIDIYDVVTGSTRARPRLVGRSIEGGVQARRKAGRRSVVDFEDASSNCALVYTEAGNLPAIVDLPGFRKMPPGARIDARVEIQHFAANVEEGTGLRAVPGI